MILDNNTPLTDNILTNNCHPLANSVSMYYLFTGYVKPEGATHIQGGVTCSMFKGVQFLQSIVSIGKRSKWNLIHFYSFEGEYSSIVGVVYLI